MKIRTGFVTNSSSSSFIIGAENEEVTKDAILHVIQELYREYFAIRDRLMERMDEYHLIWNEEYQTFDVREDADWRDVEDSLHRDFGIDTWYHYGYDIGWLDVKTYRDYEVYWKERRKDGWYEPFTMADYTVGEVDQCLFDESIFGWYIHCDGTVQEEEGACEHCELSFDDERCKAYRQGVRNGTITEGNRVTAVLGKICVESWEGDIPYYVAHKLSEMSRFSCIHMG